MTVTLVLHDGPLDGERRVAESVPAELVVELPDGGTARYTPDGGGYVVGSYDPALPLPEVDHFTMVWQPPAD